MYIVLTDFNISLVTFYVILHHSTHVIRVYIGLHRFSAKCESDVTFRIFSRVAIRESFFFFKLPTSPISSNLCGSQHILSPKSGWSSCDTSGGWQMGLKIGIHHLLSFFFFAFTWTVQGCAG